MFKKANENKGKYSRKEGTDQREHNDLPQKKSVEREVRTQEDVTKYPKENPMKGRYGPPKTLSFPS